MKPLAGQDASAGAARAGEYVRHRPEQTLLHQGKGAGALLICILAQTNHQDIASARAVFGLMVSPIIK